MNNDNFNPKIFDRILSSITNKNIIKFHGKQLDIDSADIDGVDEYSYPDFIDAFVDSIKYKNGKSLNVDELDELNEDDDLINNIANAFFQ